MGYDRLLPYRYDRKSGRLIGAITVQEAHRSMLVGLSLAYHWEEEFGRPDSTEQVPVIIPIGVKRILTVPLEEGGEVRQIPVSEFFNLPEFRDVPPQLRDLGQFMSVNSQPIRLGDCPYDDPAKAHGYEIDTLVAAQGRSLQIFTSPSGHAKSMTQGVLGLKGTGSQAPDQQRGEPRNAHRSIRPRTTGPDQDDATAARAFAFNLLSIIRVGHKRLHGTFTDHSGSCLAVSNLGINGSVQDLETFASSDLGDPPIETRYQLEDLRLALHALREFCCVLNTSTASVHFVEAVRKGYAVYTEQTRVPQIVSRLARGHLSRLSRPPDLTPVKPFGELSEAFYQDASWRSKP